MSQQRLFHRNQRVELTINELAFEGKGIARINTEKGQFVVFVPNTLPGQKILSKIIKCKSNYAEGKLLEVLEKSDEEIESPYFPIPGAPYISLPIERQHYYKQKTTVEVFKRIGNISNSKDLLDQFIPSPNNFHYRNKMEYAFSSVVYDPVTRKEYDGLGLGSKRRGHWLAVEALGKDSGLFDEQLENNIPKIQKFFEDRGHSGWHAKKNTGFCRFMMAKKSFYQDSLLINLVTSSSEVERFDVEAFKDLMLDILGDRLSGLLYTINDDPGDRPVTEAGQRRILHGKPELIEKICGLKFRISPESFFQTNPACAEKLYEKALDYVFEADLGDKPLVLDLFSGTGTITQLLARRSENKTIIGVELMEEAVADARENADMNGVYNLSFYSNDVGKFLLENPQYTGKIGTLVMDPPRAGVTPKTLRKVIRLDADRIVYISCNPATQARDMATLREAGYELIKYSLVDQFPHTSHIESIALFEKKENSTLQTETSIHEQTDN